MDINELIKNIESQLSLHKLSSDPDDETNWYDKVGILLTAEQAESILDIIKTVNYLKGDNFGESLFKNIMP